MWKVEHISIKAVGPNCLTQEITSCSSATAVHIGDMTYMYFILRLDKEAIQFNTVILMQRELIT